MDEVEKHMLQGMWHSISNPENPDRLEVHVRDLRERVAKLETKMSVAGAFLLAFGTISGALANAWGRVKGN